MVTPEPFDVKFTSREVVHRTTCRPLSRRHWRTWEPRPWACSVLTVGSHHDREKPCAKTPHSRYVLNAWRTYDIVVRWSPWPSNWPALAAEIVLSALIGAVTDGSARRLKGVVAAQRRHSDRSGWEVRYQRSAFRRSQSGPKREQQSRVPWTS